MDWETKNQGFLRLMYLLMARYDGDTIEELAGEARELFGRPENRRYADKRLKKKAMSILQSLEY